VEGNPFLLLLGSELGGLLCSVVVGMQHFVVGTVQVVVGSVQVVAGTVFVAGKIVVVGTERGCSCHSCKVAVHNGTTPGRIGLSR